MNDFLMVFLGGGLGSVVRFYLGKGVNALHNHPFPFGTFAVNIAACLVLGLVIGLADHRQLISPQAKLFWAVGFCGGFSTFSTFSNETLILLQAGLTLHLALYIGLSLMVCIAATYGGIYLGEHIG
jgi:fluoride exporter